ncbi:MAG: vWA domain-containing protein [Mangrovicoccus sp.]
MSGVPDITLLRPLFLLAVPLLGAFIWYWLRRQGMAGAWQKAASPEILQALSALGWVSAQGGRVTIWLSSSVAVAILLALAGPAIERRDTLSFRNLDGAILVLDVSPSVTESPRWPQMQTMARVAMGSLGNRPAGAVVFAGDAYLASGLTMDHRELGQTLSLLDAQTVPDPGSRPARGLALALQMVAQSELLSGDVLLLSDGAGIGPESLALVEDLRQRNLRLSVIALETPGPEMTALAQLGGGRVFTLEETDALATWLSDMSRSQMVRQSFPLLYWRDLGRWGLALALLPLLMLFRRSGP